MFNLNTLHSMEGIVGNTNVVIIMEDTVKRLVFAAVIVAFGLPAQAGGKSERCRDVLRDAYVALSVIPVQMSDALSQARADGITPDPSTLSAPDKFSEDSAAWKAKLIELSNTWCVQP